MAEIIYRGTLPGKRKYRVECPECSSIIDFTPAEDRQPAVYQYNEKCREASYVCPVCSYSMDYDIVETQENLEKATKDIRQASKPIFS